MRASDEDRTRVLRRLGEDYVAGRLTSDEHAIRSDAAAEARTKEELDALLADLPSRRPSALRLHALAFGVGSVVLLAAWWLTRDDTPLPTDEGAGFEVAVQRLLCSRGSSGATCSFVRRRMNGRSPRASTSRTLVSPG